jgi:hypothetical protein
MPEFEELTLRVTLVDEASPQIDLIRRNIKELATAKSDIEGLRQKTSEFGEQLKHVADAVARGPEAWLKFAASFGAVGVAVEAVGHGIFSLNDELKKFGEEMLKIDVVAKRAGTDPGTVQNFIEIARTAGISAETVNRELIQMRQNLGQGLEFVTAMAKRIAFLPGGAEIFQRLQENLRLTHIPEEQALLIKRAVHEYSEIVATSLGPERAAYERERLGKLFGPQEIIERFPNQIQQMSQIRKQIAEREVAASKEVVKLQGDIINNFNRIFGMLKINIMEDTLFGQGLKAMAALLKLTADDLQNRRIAPKEPGQQFPRGGPMEGETLQPGPEGFRQQQRWFREKKRQQQLKEQLEHPEQQGGPSIWERGWSHLRDYFRGRTHGGGATEPQKLMSGEGVAGFTGEYPGMTPESWKGAADWAEQLHGEYSTNIERRDLMNNQNDETKKLIEQIRRTNALLSGEEQPTDKLGLLTTKMGGLPPGLGAGRGVGGVPPMGPTGLPPEAGAPPTGAPPTGAPPTGGTTTGGRPAGPYPQGTHGGPGGPPITPTAPGGTVPATLPGAAPLGPPVGGGFTPVPDLTTYTGQPRDSGAAGAGAGAGAVIGAGDYTPGYSGPMGFGASGGVPAVVRYNNPGGMYPSPITLQYGSNPAGTQRIGGGHPIAQFPSPDHGAAANMEFARKHGLGKTLGQLRHYHVYGNWNGSLNLPGVDSNHVITAEDLNNRDFMTRYTQATIQAEGRKNTLSQKTLDTGFDMYQAGGAKQYEAKRAAAPSVADRPVPTAPTTAPTSRYTELKTRPVEPGQAPTTPPSAEIPQTLMTPPVVPREQPALPREAFAPERLYTPGRQAPPNVAVAPGNQMPRADTGFISPVAGAPAISEFGDPRTSATGKHQGIDIGGNNYRGAPIVTTTSDQKILQSGHLGKLYGWGVKTIDSQGRMHVYAHMIEDPTKLYNLKVGDVLGQGHQIGRVGNSGNAASTPSHVHYEVRPPGGSYAASYDPRRFLPPLAGEPGYQPPGQQPTRVAGPSDVGVTGGPKIEMLRTRPIEPALDFSGRNLLAPTRQLETDEERDNRRSRALSHMPGWQGKLAGPETEWQMRGGDFGARARRARNIFRARDEEEPAGPETEWQMRGGDFGARARRARNIFRARDEEEPDRSMIDRAGAGGLMRRRLLGTGKIDVTVKSKGQESVEQKGPFKAVKWHRHTQMQEADHGPANPKEMTGGEGPGAGPG